MNFTHPFFPRHSQLFKGGGGTTVIEQATPPPAPAAPPEPAKPTLLAPAAPPATTTSTEVRDAQRDARKQAGKRQGINSTLLGSASEAKAAPQLGGAATGKNTLLGGG